MRGVKLAVAASCCAVFVLSLWGFNRTLPERIEGTLSGTLSAPYIRFIPVNSPESSSVRTVLVVHGLNSNKEFMQMLSMSLADGGFDTWAIDLPGHGDSPEKFSSEASQEAIETALDSLPAETIVVGHSLGAGLLADLAVSRRLGTAILLSPPPLRLVPINIDRLLVVSGGFDAPRIAESVPALLESVNGVTEWWHLPWSGHSTALYNPLHLRRIVEWADGSASSLRTGERIFWLALLVTSTVIAPACGLRLMQRSHALASDKTRPRTEARPTEEVAGWIGSLSVGLVILAFFNPLSWLHLFRTDYLVGLLLISGLIMWRGRKIDISLHGAMRGTLAAAYIILVMSVVGSSIMHLIPSGEQWLRLPTLTLAGFPLFLHDEQTVRLYRPWWLMWGTFLLTRLLIWAAVIMGVLLLNPEAVFLVLIAHLIVLSWLPLWWLSGIVARATGEPGSAALFSALVQGWVFAALFVTI